MTLIKNTAYISSYNDYDYQEASTVYMYIVEADDNDNYSVLLASNDWFGKIDLFMGLEGELSDDYGNFTGFKQIAPKK